MRTNHGEAVEDMNLRIESIYSDQQTLKRADVTHLLEVSQLRRNVNQLL